MATIARCSSNGNETVLMFRDNRCPEYVVQKYKAKREMRICEARVNSEVAANIVYNKYTGIM
jgi:hypothetical protein